MKMDPHCEASGYTVHLSSTLPTLGGCGVKGRVRERPGQQKRSEESGFSAHSELHPAPPALGEVHRRRLNPDTFKENQKL